jgi:hypothetical protein
MSWRALSFALIVTLVACRRSAKNDAAIRRDEPPAPAPTCQAFERRAMPTPLPRTVRDLVWSVDALALLVDEGQAQRSVHLLRDDGSPIGVIPLHGDRLRRIAPRRLAVFGRPAVIIDLERGCWEPIPTDRREEAIVAIDPVRQAVLVQRPGELAWRALRDAPPIAAAPIAVNALAIEVRGRTLAVQTSNEGVQLRDATTMALLGSDLHHVKDFALAPGGDRIALAEVFHHPYRHVPTPAGAPPQHVPAPRHSIHVVSSEGREIETIDQNAEHLAWSNDGRALAFTGGGFGFHRGGVTGAGLRIHRDGETKVLEGTPNHGLVAWAPDDLSVAVVDRGALEIWRLDGTLVRSLTARPTP